MKITEREKCDRDEKKSNPDEPVITFVWIFRCLPGNRHTKMRYKSTSGEGVGEHKWVR